MSSTMSSITEHRELGVSPGRGSRDIELVPRLRQQGYSPELVTRRRRWVEEKTGCELGQVGSYTVDPEQMRGNIENPIGAVQVPLAVAGPLRIRGEHARGTFFVPLATTEGALVRSYERGMVALTRAGGAEVRLWADENRISPIFTFPDVSRAFAFAQRVDTLTDEIRAVAESTTRHGRLLGTECQPIGRRVIVHFRFATGDAQGMNMIAVAAEAACQLLQDRAGDGAEVTVLSGASSEKRASGSLLAGGKGKKLTAGALLPDEVVRRVLHSTPEQMVELWHRTVLGHLQTGALGYNGHFANGLTALFIACGQDVANVVNAAVGITDFQVDESGGLYASVTLPSLPVATVGGGTQLGTADECLAMLGCRGSGQAVKLAEIVAATLLAGELSMGGALSSREFVAAHQQYGRNHPSGPRGNP